MEKIIKFSLLLCLFSFCVSVPSYAQKRKKKKKTEEYFDESGGFKHRLWYGGNFNLGLSNGLFNIGITPMVGYKITDRFSVGPRFKVDYLSAKLQDQNGNVASFKTTSWGIGVFSRAKVISNFFAHVEYEFENLDLPVVVNGYYQLEIDDPTKISTSRENRNNFYLGAGYSSGNILSFEIVLLYNALEAEDSARLPWDLRFGFTYNF